MTFYRRLFVFCVMLTACLPQSSVWAQEKSGAGRFTYRWVYVSQNLQVEDNVVRVEALMKRAKAAGYNGIVLADYKLNILRQVPAHYFVNLARVKATADAMGMAIFPCVASIGYSNGLLANDPNLAEGLPVRDAPFVVGNGVADLVPASNLLTGGDFERAASPSKPDTAQGWGFQDAPGSGSFLDHAVFHEGSASLRFDDIGSANRESGNGRVSQKVTLVPWTQYHLSAWVKTEQFVSASDVRCVVLPQVQAGQHNSGKEGLCYNAWAVKPTQEWTQFHAVFNSLNATQTNLYIGVWGGKSGKLWIDDVRLQPVGLLNVVRRDGCPLSVRSDDNKTTYEEGRDFAPIKDEKMGTVPYPGNYEVFHTPPTIHLLPNSRIKNGQALRVGFFHTVVVNDDQVASCLSNPQVKAVVATQLADVSARLHPPGFFMSHDELRVAGWDNDCATPKTTPGKLLADNAAWCAAEARKVSPKADVFFWSDMFDPFHNAHDDYYLVNGTLAGSWEGLPKNAVIVNWNSGKPTESLNWFAQRGHRQILAGYYDSNPNNIKSWLQAGKNLPNSGRIVGVMYTTWRGNYADLEAFASAAWGNGSAAQTAGR